MIDIEINDLSDSIVCSKCGIVLHRYKVTKESKEPYSTIREGKCPLCKQKLSFYED